MLGSDSLAGGNALARGLLGDLLLVPIEDPLRGRMPGVAAGVVRQHELRWRTGLKNVIGEE